MTLYDDVFAALARAGVPYVVVGGVAVVLHGHVRATVDLDLVVDLAEEPARRAVDVLLSCGLLPRLPVDPHGFADPEIRQGWIVDRNLTVFSFFDPARPGREVDVFASHPLPFEDLLAEATEVQIKGVVVPLASIQHLLTMKRMVGRPQDLADVAALEEVQRLQDEGL